MTEQEKLIQSYPNILVFLAALHRKPLHGTPYENTIAIDAVHALEHASGVDLDAEAAAVAGGSKMSFALEQRIQDVYRAVFKQVMDRGLATMVDAKADLATTAAEKPKKKRGKRV